MMDHEQSKLRRVQEFKMCVELLYTMSHTIGSHSTVMNTWNSFNSMPIALCVLCELQN